MEEVVFVNKQIIIRFYHRCTQLGNFPRPNYAMKYSNRDLLAKITKNLAINIRFVVIKGKSRVSDKVFCTFH